MNETLAEIFVQKKATKSKTPTVNAPELKDKLHALMDMKLALKDLEARIEMTQAELLPQIERLRIDLSRQVGDRVGSIRVNNTLYVTYHNSQKNYDDDACTRIASVFGGDAFNKYFKPAYELDLSSVPEQLLQQAVSAISKLVDLGAAAKRTTKAVAALEYDRTLNVGIEAMCKEAGIMPVQSLRA